MFLNGLRSVTFAVLWMHCAVIDAAPLTLRGNTPAPYVGDSSRDSLTVLKRELRNQEEDLTTLKERLGTLDNQMEQLNREHQEELSVTREQLKISQKKAEEKIAALEKMILSLIADLKQLHEFSQKQLTREEQQRERIDLLEQALTQQQKNQEHLQNASQKLAEAFAASNEPSSRHLSTSLGTGTYQVQSGDSLEKIARRYGISLQQIKQMNSIPSEKDRIIAGQILKVPVVAP